MAGNTAAYHQNFTSEKKPTDIVEKDIRKWVESVVEFKAKMDKQKTDAPLEKRLKKNKKFRSKKKAIVANVTVGSVKPEAPVQPKQTKPKKQAKRPVKHAEEKPKEETQVIDFFEAIKETYRTLKLPPNWTSGLSNNRVVFNRIKVTTQNAQQKMAVERSLIITKDCNTHILINGVEIAFANWEVQKINSVDDIKKAIKDIDSLKLCEGGPNGVKNPQCSGLIDGKQKVCDACKSDMTSPPKTVKKKQKVTKKTSGAKELPKQKSFQK